VYLRTSLPFRGDGGITHSAHASRRRLGDQRECKVSDFRTSGNKMSWTVQCSGLSAMTGQGEITRAGADAYSGTVNFNSADGVMTTKLTGRRIGACRDTE
jgi:hypothetical protein